MDLDTTRVTLVRDIFSPGEIKIQRVEDYVESWKEGVNEDGRVISSIAKYTGKNQCTRNGMVS